MDFPAPFLAAANSEIKGVASLSPGLPKRIFLAKPTNALYKCLIAFKRTGSNFAFRSKMGKKKKHDIRELLEIVYEFHDQDKTLTDIGKDRGRSTTYIAKLLKEAREMGIWTIKIESPRLEDKEMELKTTFGLKDARVVPSFINDFAFERGLCGRAAAKYFDEKISDGTKSFAVGGGNSLFDLVSSLDDRERRIEIFPTAMMGRGPIVQSPDRAVIMSILWARCQGKAIAHYASIPPAENISTIGQLQAEHNRLLRERAIVRNVYEGMQRVGCVFTGLGPAKSSEAYAKLHPNGTIDRLADMGIIPKDMEAAGAAGEISYDFFNSNGETRADWKLAISIGVNELREMVKEGREVVMVAGLHREKALKAALKGRLLSTLITDFRTATELVDDERVRTTHTC